MQSRQMSFLAALCLLFACTHAGTAADAPEIASYTLENGLEIVLIPDHRVPKVAMSLTYRVGSMNEPPGRSGFAHLFEHLMFTGTEAMPDIDIAYGELGITLNAFTAEDETVYWADGLASTLPVMLSVEADRMANLGANVDADELAVQRDVVLNEMRQNILDQPGAGAGTALNAALFPVGHPYSRAVIGSIPDLDAATLDDVRAFFSIYYVPNNAVLVVVGDFEIAEAKALIEETFGLVSRGADVPRPEAEPFAPARVRLAFVDKVPVPDISLAITGPGADRKADVAMLVAADLLGNYEYGAFRRELVNTGIATYAYASWSSGLLAGRFYIGGAPAPGTTIEQLEAALRKSVADFLARPVLEADVARTRQNLLLGFRTGIESYINRALAVSARVALGMDPATVLGDDPTIAAITAADVEAAMRRIIVLDDASVVVVSPGARAAFPAVLTEASGVATPLVLADRPAVAVPILEAGTPEAAAMPEKQTATLSNGIEIVHYHLPDAPMFYLAATVTGGVMSDPKGKEGLYSLAARMAYRGAGNRDLDAFTTAAKDLGADLSSSVGDQAASVILSAPPDNFEAALPLLVDALEAPRFDEREWTAMLNEVNEGIKQRDTNAAGNAYRALAAEVFHPAPGDPALLSSLASIAAISRDDAKAAYQALFTPNAMTFYTAGALPIETVTAALETAFGNWHSDAPGLPPKPHAEAEFPAGRKLILVPDPGASQAVIFLARPAPGYDLPGQRESIVVSRLLGGDFLSRLNSVIREEKGYSYGVDSYLWETLATNSGLIVEVPVATDVLGPALTEVLNGFAELQTVPVTEDELTRNLTAFLTGMASTSETAGGLFGAVVSGLESGLSLEELLTHQEQMTTLTLADVQAAATALAGLDTSVIAIAGDADAVLPQLTALGFTDVEVLPAP